MRQNRMLGRYQSPRDELKLTNFALQKCAGFDGHGRQLSMAAYNHIGQKAVDEFHKVNFGGPGRKFQSPPVK
jgi:hypothetical protein